MSVPLHDLFDKDCIKTVSKNMQIFYENALKK